MEFNANNKRTHAGLTSLDPKRKKGDNSQPSVVIPPNLKPTLAPVVTPRVSTGKSLTSIPAIRSSAVVKACKDFSDKFAKLLDFELEDDLQQVENRLSHWNKDRLEKEGICLTGMHCFIFGEYLGDLILMFVASTYEGAAAQPDIPYNRFSHGDMVMISRKEPLKKGGFSSEKTITGTILEKNNHHIKVSVSEIPDGAESGVWRLDKGANLVSHDRMITGLKAFTSYSSTSSDLRDMIIGGIERTDLNTSASQKPNLYAPQRSGSTTQVTLPSASSLLKPEMMEGLNLNDSQKEAIKSAIGRKLNIIQGPPGTGKTHTAVCLLKIIVDVFGGRCPTILATADTNVAVDNLLEGLLSFGIRALRVGQPVKVRKELHHATLQEKMKAHLSAEELNNEKNTLQELLRVSSSETDPDKANTLHRQISSCRDRIKKMEGELTKRVIEEAQVICATCIGAGHEILTNISFPIVLVDEATQATEPSVLVPLVHKSKQLFLLGDHYQLPPTVISDRAREAGLNVSLFSRLANQGLKPLMLTIQYRMHPVLSEYPSAAFYHGKLVDGVTAEQRPTPVGFDFPKENAPVAFLNLVGGKEGNTPEGSKFNLKETEEVLKVVKGMLSAGMNEKEVGVVTPYSGQVRKLQKMFEEDPQLANVDISSVDGYQGREKEVIVFSTVRSNPKGKVGFLSDWRRLNVAMTRARRGLIVLGDKTTLVNDEYWKKWVTWAEEHGVVIDINVAI